ncbi:hypothetical protein Y1Q_0013829 [Alligator mississippiensis]|uniref:Uncharacterized protein n=1 Tax=Alligator mississippiensis TaxID=8496 RepID=A0A151NFU2_ALLMI|nr:hypothetical protein Y1Q_0013829 [Alligator mississippiensis]
MQSGDTWSPRVGENEKVSVGFTFLCVHDCVEAVSRVSPRFYTSSQEMPFSDSFVFYFLIMSNHARRPPGSKADVKKQPGSKTKPAPGRRQQEMHVYPCPQRHVHG